LPDAGDLESDTGLDPSAAGLGSGTGLSLPDARLGLPDAGLGSPDTSLGSLDVRLDLPEADFDPDAGLRSGTDLSLPDADFDRDADFDPDAELPPSTGSAPKAGLGMLNTSLGRRWACSIASTAALGPV
jgi:hypothetical protein